MSCGNTVSLREKFLAITNKLRALPTAFGLRLYTVTMRVTTYTPGIFDVPGEGTPTVIDTPLYLDGYGTLPFVEKLTTKDIVASGGVYTDGDYRVGAMTPVFVKDECDGSMTVAGVPITWFEQPEGTVPTQITYLITGPEFPNGALFKKIETWTSDVFTYSFIVRKIGNQP